MTGWRSVMTAFRCRLSEISPKRAISGFFPFSRRTVTWKHVRRPSGVLMVALYLRAIFMTVDLCLLARVLSIDVSMTQRNGPRRETSWAKR